MLFDRAYAIISLFERRNGGNRFEKDSDNFYRMYMLFPGVGDIVSSVAFIKFG